MHVRFLKLQRAEGKRETDEKMAELLALKPRMPKIGLAIIFVF
jgi:hypothetical protein